MRPTRVSKTPTTKSSTARSPVVRDINVDQHLRGAERQCAEDGRTAPKPLTYARRSKQGPPLRDEHGIPNGYFFLATWAPSFEPADPGRSLGKRPEFGASNSL